MPSAYEHDLKNPALLLSCVNRRISQDRSLLRFSGHSIRPSLRFFDVIPIPPCLTSRSHPGNLTNAST